MPSSNILRTFGVRLCAALCLTAVAAGAAAQAVPADIKSRGFMIVATEDNYPPFNFIRDGQPAGFNHELYAIFKNWVGVEVRQQIMPWQGLLSGLLAGQFDMALTATTITEPRSRQLDFTMPIAEGTYYYVKRKGDNRIKSFKDLSGMRGCTQGGSAMQQRLSEVDKRLQATGGKLGPFSFFASYPETYLALSGGRCDYAINSVIPLSDLVRQRPDEFELGEAVDEVLYQAWAVKKGNRELLALANRFLLEQRRNGTIAKLQAKWLAREFPDLPEQPLLPGGKPIQ
jgi:polar amino acid transport system substrate-binding protein